MLEMKKKTIFGTSLNPVLPPILSAWSCDYGILPKSHPICFQGLCFQKKGAIGQQQKAYSVLTSRKMAEFHL